MGEVGKNLTNIAMALISVSLITLLVGNAQGTATVVKSVTSGFGGLLGVVTLQNQYGNPLGGA